jgi:PAS domain S-box-containing protein
MSGAVRSTVVKYGASILIFGVILGIALLLSYFGIKINLTILIVAGLVLASWYGGLGPGILLCILLEATTIYYTPIPPDSSIAKAYFGYVSVLLLLIFLVFLISGRKSAERRLREQSELFRVTLSSIGDAVIATDIEGHVSFLNPTAERLTGWTFAEAKARPIDEIFQISNEDPDAEAVESPFALVKRHGTTASLTNHTVLLAKDGRKLPIDESGAPIRNANGHIVGVVVVFHDVSEKRSAERERELLLSRETKARADAETANRLKDDFLSTVSHELRTPLNAIVGWTGLLKSKVIREEEAIQNALAVIERNARTQNNLINDILDVSRIVSGKLALDLAPVRLADVVASAIESLKPEADAKKIEIEAKLFTSPVVEGDSGRLQQIFANLLSNAVKFTAGAGKIDVQLTGNEEEAVVSISDSGVGIASEDVAHVFDRFRQLDSSTRRSAGGLGLGLAIVKNLTELHGGKVTAHSDGPGQGATFTVELPIEKSAVTGNGTSSSTSEKLELSGLKILVVDDNADSLDICRVGLEEFGAITMGADSCAAAVPLFTSFKPDILVSDLGMPGEDGFDLISKIRSLPPSDGGRTPAAAVTAYARKEDREKALAAGYQTHVAKPVDMYHLAREIIGLVQNGGKRDGRNR